MAAIKRNKLPPLDDSAMARLNSVMGNAEAKLGRDISEFFAGCFSGIVVKKLRRKPSNWDLRAFFDAYAVAVFDKAAEEQLRNIHDANDLKLYRKWLKNNVEQVARPIGINAGLWQRTV